MRMICVLLLFCIFACDKSTTNPGAATSTTSTSTDGVAADQTTDTTAPDSSNDSNPGDGTSSTEDAWTLQFMKLVNDHRASIDLQALIHVEGLGDIVTAHSEDMATGRVSFGHTGFSSRCSQGYDVLGGGNWCGENVANGQKTPEAAFNAWMNSSGHRANIEKASATHTGFGYAQSSSGSFYWTQIFIQR